MGSLNLENLKNNKNEISKAEVISLFSLLEKTFTEWWKKREFFQSYSEQFSDIEKEYKNLISSFSNIIFNLNLKFNNNSVNSINAFDDFINPNWRSWRGIKLQNEPQKFLQVLYGSCEGINSGIEKGSPSESYQISEINDKPYLSSSFGAKRVEVSNNNLNKLREILFSGKLVTELPDKAKKYLKSIKVLNKNINTILGELTSNLSIWKIIEIRIRIFNLICLLYKDIPSDSRFPANDTSLFDQAYMSTSLFKAALAGILLDAPNSEIDISSFDHRNIKWSILGIQYDKLGLAEKGLKAASIKWYRDTSYKVDNEVKKLIELEYALGNEVYRDETGIYFVVAENVIGEKQGDFYKFNNSLNGIKTEIQEIFSNNFEGEIYPAIFLTEPSRGLMNLGYLVEKAKDNFLKAEYPENFKEKLKHDSEPNGICQICGMRLAHKKDRDSLICDVCGKRLKGRRASWYKNPKGETIWLDELQDKNGRVALVTLKFELGKWLDGDLVNSLVVRDEDFKNYLSNIEEMLKRIKAVNDFSLLRNIVSSSEVSDFVRLFDKNAIQKPFESILRDKILRKILTQQLNSLSEREKGLWNLFFRCLDCTLIALGKSINDWINYIGSSFSVSPNFAMEDKRFRNQNIFRDSNFNLFIKESFGFGFIIMQVYNIILERSIGSKWEKFIYKELEDWDNSGGKPLKQKIDFDDRIIHWNKLDDNDIKFLSVVLLQFLLRKNPSPARLRRMWETTREFFEELESKLVDKLMLLPEGRKKRIVITLKNGDGCEGEECRSGEILFWKSGNEIRTITSIGKIANYLGKELKIFSEVNFRSVKNDIKALIIEKVKKVEIYNKNEHHTIEFNNDNIEDINIEAYQPYFTILKPTPISWQFIIPAENLPELIKNIQEEYYKHFKWVYGKLPLHIGVVVQNYKRPLYIGIKALRKIRRDGIKWDKLGKEIPAKDFKARQKEAFHYQGNPENMEWCEKFYSLFEKIESEGKYEFYLYPERGKKVWLDTTQNITETDKFMIYPNTIDFEFLDANTRRNDIYYNKETGKRYLKTRQLRPYDLNNWQYFEKFREFFLKDKKSSSKLQKLISLIYSKMEDWDDLEALKRFMISTFVNVLELRDDKDDFAGILGVDKFDELQNMDAEEFNEKLLMLTDMFDFWHTILKGGN